MVEKIEDCLFSDFLDCINKKTSLARRLDMSLILNMLSNDIKNSQKRYQQFVIETDRRAIRYGLCCRFSSG